jgi:hypothetical protein
MSLGIDSQIASHWQLGVRWRLVVFLRDINIDGYGSAVQVSLLGTEWRIPRTRISTMISLSTPTTTAAEVIGT